MLKILENNQLFCFFKLSLILAILNYFFFCVMFRKIVAIMREAEQMTPEDEYSERLIANGCVISSLCYFILSATVSVLVVVVRLVENGIIFYAYVDDERDLVIRLISNFAITCGTLNMTISFVLLCFRNPQFRAKIAKKLKLSNCVTEGEAQSSRQNKTTAKQDESKCTNQKKQDMML